MAATLAAGHEDDEPAALFLALLLEAEALGNARNTFPIVAVAQFLRATRQLDLVVDLAARQGHDL